MNANEKEYDGVMNGVRVLALTGAVAVLGLFGFGLSEKFNSQAAEDIKPTPAEAQLKAADKGIENGNATMTLKQQKTDPGF